ncbi:hypothetical protein I4U23_003855 [Adineta vaga]|nr:hypothetical protein I4U23_003855 [Adineta vaga]
MARRWVAVSAIGFAVVVAIVLGLIPVYLRKSNKSGSITDSLDTSLNSLSIYPTGSYKANMAEFTQSTETNRSFLPLNQSLLTQIAAIDNSSFVFEAGREQFLYFRVSQDVFVQQRSTFSLSGIGIHFGRKNDSLNVVPINNQQQSSAGVTIIPTNLPDRSTLVRIRIATMPTMCSQTGIDDSCTNVEYSAYLIFGKTQLSSSSIINQANVACGDICSSSDSYLACSAFCGAQCDGNQVAGADTPVSRRYNLGRKYSQFKFQYETYSIRDRIKVWNDIELLFDSGCVGTQGDKSTYLTLSNKNNIRVDVEPNCACQSLSGCTGQNGISQFSDGTEITNGMILYITEDAGMPSLVASSCEAVEWEVLFNYQAKFTGALSFSKTLTGQSSDSSSFDIVRSLQGEVIGGAITAKWTILATKVTAAQESNGGKQFNNGYPLFSAAHDNGYGIYQITNPSPTYNEVWNWKANVDKGIQILNQKTNAAITWMNDQRAQARQQTGRDQPVDDHRVGSNCFFSDNSTRTIVDAVAIKQFNGASGGNYCA